MKHSLSGTAAYGLATILVIASLYSAAVHAASPGYVPLTNATTYLDGVDVDTIYPQPELAGQEACGIEIYGTTDYRILDNSDCGGKCQENLWGAPCSYQPNELMMLILGHTLDPESEETMLPPQGVKLQAAANGCPVYKLNGFDRTSNPIKLTGKHTIQNSYVVAYTELFADSPSCPYKDNVGRTKIDIYVKLCSATQRMKRQLLEKRMRSDDEQSRKKGSQLDDTAVPEINYDCPLRSTCEECSTTPGCEWMSCPSDLVGNMLHPPTKESRDPTTFVKERYNPEELKKNHNVRIRFGNMDVWIDSPTEKSLGGAVIRANSCQKRATPASTGCQIIPYCEVSYSFAPVNPYLVMTMVLSAALLLATALYVLGKKKRVYTTIEPLPYPHSVTIPPAKSHSNSN